MTITAKDPSVTIIGNTELSSLDKEKLQCMYDCSGQTKSNCGGHFYGTSGTLSGSCCCGGDWLLTSEMGKGIFIDFSAFSIPGDCNSEYLEIRRSGALIGKYCDANPPPLSLDTKTAYLWINFVKTEDSSASFAATWAAEMMICCTTVKLENFGSHTFREGLYSPMTDGTTHNGVPVYVQQDGGQHMWYGGNWRVGTDFNGGYGIQSLDKGLYCPEDVSTWTSYDSEANEMIEEKDADARCSNCALYPTYDECLTCCDSVIFNSSHPDWAEDWGLVFGGIYNLYEAKPILNGKAVYKRDKYCLSWSHGTWSIHSCEDLGNNFYFIQSSLTMEQCVHRYDGSWSWKGNDDSAMAATCSADCSGDPPSAPEESTSDWDGISRSVDTIVTYTCSDGQTSVAVCDGATTSWLPSTIPECPSDAEPMPVVNDCILKSKITILKTLKKKKMRTVQLCQEYCYKINEATHFKWKWNKQAKKRFCFCQAIGYNTKKSWTSGPTIC